MSVGRPLRPEASAARSPLKVGLVCPYSFAGPGGVQAHVRGLAAYLASQGHQPHILAPGNMADEDGDLVFTSAGAAVPVPYNGSIARVNFGPLSAARVRRWLHNGAFDLIHVHEPITPSISVLALWAADVPVVATFHTATPRSRTMQLAGSALRASIEKIDAGVAVSESARNVVVQHLGRDAVVIPNGLAYADFAGQVNATGWRGGSRPRVTFLGRVDEPRKGLQVLLAAVPAIVRGAGDVDVVVAGAGACDLPGNVRGLGTVSDADKVRLLAGTDVFVAPQRGRESFGIVMLEAMASGAGIVASDLPPFADLLRAHGEYPADRLGDLFPVGDHHTLAEAVLSQLSQPDPVRIERARSWARRYDWAVVGALLCEVYRAALPVHSSPAGSRPAGSVHIGRGGLR